MQLGRPFTRTDLEGMPDDGRRYEMVLLHTACPADLEALAGPFGIGLADDTELRPDLLVGRLTDFTDKELLAAPVLAVEVIEPSTRLTDLHLKRARYEQAGTPGYWVFDPAEVRLIAWELSDDGFYHKIADVMGGEKFTTEFPFPMTVVPADLVR
jgi:hypothetical protein